MSQLQIPSTEVRPFRGTPRAGVFSFGPLLGSQLVGVLPSGNPADWARSQTGGLMRKFLGGVCLLVVLGAAGLAAQNSIDLVTAEKDGGGPLCPHYESDGLKAIKLALGPWVDPVGHRMAPGPWVDPEGVELS